jgi:hypothetical protein
MTINVVATMKFSVVISNTIFNLLREASRNHYDYTCRQVSSEGGLLHEVPVAIFTGFELTFRELDLLSKIAEGEPELLKQFRQEIRDAMSHYNKIVRVAIN